MYIYLYTCITIYQQNGDASPKNYKGVLEDCRLKHVESV